MAKLDPVIAVKDIEASSNWYQPVFNGSSLHGGDHSDILVAEMMKLYLSSSMGAV